MLAVVASVTKPSSSSIKARLPGCARRPADRPGNSACGCGTSAPAASSGRRPARRRSWPATRRSRTCRPTGRKRSGNVCRQTVGAGRAAGDHRPIGAGRDEHRQAQIVARAPAVRDCAAASSSAISANCSRLDARIDLHDRQRVEQPLDVGRQPKQLAAEGAQLLGHGRALHEAAVAHRNTACEAGTKWPLR